LLYLCQTAVLVEEKEEVKEENLAAESDEVKKPSEI